jgi:riboflavin kinase/FMN adenylyltransferase
VQLVSELKRFSPERGTLLTVGVFDGVHLGHRQLIERLVQRALRRNLISGVITFSFHPRTVLSPKSRLARLTTLEERTALLKAFGIELVVPLTFNAEFAALSAREFVTLLQEHLKMQGLIIGPDFALGRGREGDFNRLKDLGNELGFTVEVVGPLKLEDSLVSSTVIRKALAIGDMRRTSKLLGRHFRLSGPVVGGSERGHILGFPTANIKVDSDQALPVDGVYATLGFIGNKVYKSVTNIGLRPTFDNGERTVEVFLLDFDGNIYGQDLTIELVERLRGEQKFENAEDLIAQIKVDVERAREILGQAALRKR